MTETPSTPRHLLAKAQRLTALADTLGAERQQKNEAERISQRTHELRTTVRLLDSAVQSARAVSVLDSSFDWGVDEARAQQRKFVGVIKRHSRPSDKVFNSACEDLRKFAATVERTSRRVWTSWKDRALAALPTSRLVTLDPRDQEEATRLRESLFEPGPYDNPTPATIRLFQRELRDLTELLEKAPELPAELEGIYRELSTSGVALSRIDDETIALLRRTGTLGNRIVLKVIHS
ncbi:hypothetical protein [Rhodococcus koreensis]